MGSCSFFLFFFLILSQPLQFFICVVVPDRNRSMKYISRELKIHHCLFRGLVSHTAFVFLSREEKGWCSQSIPVTFC